VKRDNPDGKPYATMQFLYRGIPQLQKMGFLNEKSLDMRNPMDQIVAGICAMNLGVELGTSHEFAKPAEGVQPLLPLIRVAFSILLQRDRLTFITDRQTSPPT